MTLADEVKARPDGRRRRAIHAVYAALDEADRLDLERLLADVSVSCERIHTALARRGFSISISSIYAERRRLLL